MKFCYKILMLRKCAADAVQMLCKCSANALPMRCKCSANALPMRCKCGANALQMRCGCGDFVQSTLSIRADKSGLESVNKKVLTFLKN